MAKTDATKGKTRGSGKGAAKASDEVEGRREAFKRWLKLNNLNAKQAATNAGMPQPSAIYNFLNGSTKSLSSAVLSKLAAANGSTVDEILNGEIAIDKIPNKRNSVPVLFRVGARGSMFVCDERLFADAPEGQTLPNGVSAAVVDGGELAFIPDGWAIFFRNEATDPGSLIGKLATVRFAGGGERPVVRMILASLEPGLFTLKALDGTLTEDVKIVAAHEIVSFGNSKISEK